MKFEIRINFYRHTTDKLILQNLLTKGSWCLSKNKFPVCANFIHFTKKRQRSYRTRLTYIVIFTTFLTYYQSQHRIVRVSRGSNKKSFAINLFRFWDLKTQQRYILQEELKSSKRGLNSLVDTLRDFLKTFDHSSKCIQIPLPKPKTEIGSTKSKNNLSAHYYNVIIEHPNRQIRLSFRFGNNNFCVFSIEKFELHGNHIILTEIVNFNHREVNHLYKNRY